MSGVLVARLDSVGDVLLTGPAVRSIAATRGPVTYLASHIGQPAAALLPGVDDVVVFDAPWILAGHTVVDGEGVNRLIGQVRARRVHEAVIFTSFHQSPLPLAMLLRLAGVTFVGAISVDHAGTLLDVRHHVDDDLHEVERNLSLVDACGYRVDADTRLQVRLDDEARPSALLEMPSRYVCVHPGASVPARTAAPSQWAEIVGALRDAGWHVLLTGTRHETVPVVRRVGSAQGLTMLDHDVGLDGLAWALAKARVVVAGNTGPAHLAAAVGTAVVSLFPPTLPAVRWRPWGVPNALLGDQDISCRGCRARRCPIATDGRQPCLASARGDAVVEMVGTVLGTAPGPALAGRS